MNKTQKEINMKLNKVIAFSVLVYGRKQESTVEAAEIKFISPVVKDVRNLII